MRIHLNLLALAYLLPFLSTAQNDISDNLTSLKFLIHDWKVTTYSPIENDDWKLGGESSAHITTLHDGGFIEEDVKYILGEEELNMRTYIGYDQRVKKFKLCAMDKEYQVMDIYYGEWEGDKLVFTNLTSDKPIVFDDGRELSFKLTYEDISSTRFIHLVHGTYDGGKTWFPFSKAIYEKKG